MTNWVASKKTGFWPGNFAAHSCIFNAFGCRRSRYPTLLKYRPEMVIQPAARRGDHPCNPVFDGCDQNSCNLNTCGIEA